MNFRHLLGCDTIVTAGNVWNDPVVMRYNFPLRKVKK